MNAKTDQELLRDYVERGQESSFQALVERHVNLVYAATLRQIRDAALAEEIVQNVFLALARKAAFLDGKNLAGWLHKAAVLKARERYREELRRKRRETAAIELGTTMKDEESLLKSLGPVLDDALLELRDRDRQALLLRYFEDKDLRQVGQCLEIGEDAAQKRVSKALSLLARIFRRRGYSVPAATIAALALRAGAQAAPAGFAVLVSETVLAKAAVASTTGLGVYLVKLMSLTKPQLLALSVAITAVPLTLQWRAANELRHETDTLRAQLAELAANLVTAQDRPDDARLQPAVQAAFAKVEP
ncbi:MAG TPA: sigma-70 family RNA polymerase sigma factor, partial [Verrucomicrobiae bacterium]|nr:sigma-70 family RNA polymerase sigma factor [Verrucomicrobiae bacterium]